MTATWRQVFELLNVGLNQRQISEQLGSSRKTIWRIIETIREIDWRMEDLGDVPRDWEQYAARGQVKMKKESAGPVHGGKEWYKDHKCVRIQDAKQYDVWRVERARLLRNGEVHYFLIGDGIRIGRLDPKRQWAKDLILDMEERGVYETESRTRTENYDRSPDCGEPGECAEGRTTEG